MMHGIIFLLHSLVRYFFPLSPATTDRDQEAGLLVQKYRFIGPLATLLFLGSAVLWGLGWFETCSMLGSVRRSLAGPCRFLIVPTRWNWVLPAIGLGILSAYLTMRVGITLLLGAERHAEYRRLEDLRWELDVRRAARFLGRSLALVSLSLLVLQVDRYAKLTNGAIAINGPFSLGEVVRPYMAIREIGRVKYTRLREKGRPLPLPHYAILFRDGTIWESETIPRDQRQGGESSAIEFASRQANRPIQQVDFLEDLGR